jgi:hypothetical protein
MHKAYSAQELNDIEKDESEFSLSFDLLKRHGIVAEFPHVIDGYGVSARLENKYAMSELGITFVDACQPPSAQGS